MSVNDIINYVNKTPGNTNPAVVRSMVENEKEKSVYASVEELKKSGGVGVSEKHLLTLDSYDGDSKPSLAPDMGEGLRPVKVSDFAIDLERLTKVFVYDDGKTKQTIHSSVCRIEKSDSYAKLMFNYSGNDINLVTVTYAGDFAGEGTWFAEEAIEAESRNMWVDSIEYETIHPIDPKFLPDTSLVFDIGDLDIGEAIFWSNTELPLPAGYMGQLVEAIEKGRSIIVTAWDNGIKIHYQMNLSGIIDNGSEFGYVLSGIIAHPYGDVYKLYATVKPSASTILCTKTVVG